MFLFSRHRRPARSTRTDTLCPDTTLFRSRVRAGETHRGRANVRRLVAASAGYLVERVRQSAKGLRANARNKSLLICEIAVRRHRAAPDLRCEPAHGQRGFSLLHKKLFSRRAQTGSNSSALFVRTGALPRDGRPFHVYSVRLFCTGSSHLDKESMHMPLPAILARNLRLPVRSEEHTSELPSLMRTSYAVFC